MKDSFGYSVSLTLAGESHGPGIVAVLSGIAPGVAVDEEFIAEHTAITPDRQHLSLLSKPDGSCEYLGVDGCLINPVKPLQCREFPEKWNFPNWQKECVAGRALLNSKSE